MAMMQPKPKMMVKKVVQVGEMGKPSQEDKFVEAMQEEWKSRPYGAPGKMMPAPKKKIALKSMKKSM